MGLNRFYDPAMTKINWRVQVKKDMKDFSLQQRVRLILGCIFPLLKEYFFGQMHIISLLSRIKSMPLSCLYAKYEAGAQQAVSLA